MLKPFELAMHVAQNWKAITGLSKKAMNEEGEFPQPVLDLIEKNGIDYMDFVDAWSTLNG